MRDGYDAASLEKIAAEAGLTKGALYHHYSGKEALFVAVFNVVCQEVIDLVGRRPTKAGTPRELLIENAMAWLKAVERNDARAILLELGPKALGFAQARALEDSIALMPLLKLVQALIETEKLNTIDALLAARIINAALTEIALLRHLSDGRTPNIKIAARAIEGVIAGVLKD